MTGTIVEIRDYHYDAERFDAYRVWAAEAVPVLQRLLDLLGFWLDAGVPARIMGSDPMELPHGSANVTWMIRWNDMEERERVWEEMWDDTGWQEVWDRHPRFDGYLHMSVRFLQHA